MTSTDSKIRPEISHDSSDDRPPMYKVLLHNDDYTTMDFVVDILIRVFGKSLEKATQIMLNVHNQGKAVCGIYPREIAETKVQTVHNLASGKGFPLKSTMEKE
ncbi:MAG: ATP-dependent Clp protease adapter ClpS [Desulfobacter postgatei]|uniref:ATP-dependent Clp protease adapter protein ClpS n=1 Tax=Desulfobacter postgatei TaxID=2293 RepID=A0A2G6MSK7_9BACT|nr:MAG: ATP-dependent Clp protease adapter ClpS [Desulfobacter postgatei]